MPPLPRGARTRYGPKSRPTICVIPVKSGPMFAAAGDSRNSGESDSYPNSDSTSTRRASSPAHASFKKAWRASGARDNAAWYRSETRGPRSADAMSHRGRCPLLLPLRCMRQLAQEPGLGKLPVPHDRLHRHLEHVRRLLDRQPAEMPQFDDPRLPFVNRRQRLQGIVERDEIAWRERRRGHIFVECDVRRSPAALPKRTRTRVVDQNPSHQSRRHGEKVRAVAPLNFVHVYQPEKRLVYECGRLKDMVFPL